MYRKAEQVMEAMMRAGFCMTTKEFFKTTLFKLLKRYGIREKLAPEEYYRLLRLIIDQCAENDMKKMGIDFFEDDDWKDK